MSRFKTVAVVSLLALIPILTATKPSTPRGTGLTGVQEFFTSGTFTAPDEVSHVMVTMWGAGGGAGDSYCPNDFSGGRGGGGAYTNTVVPVTPGLTYTVTVGSAGTTGGGNGSNGGDSQFALGNTVLTFAGGGQGGTGSTNSAPGTEGIGGQADGTAQISHEGSSGYTSASYAANLAPQAHLFRGYWQPGSNPPNPDGYVFYKDCIGCGGRADCVGYSAGPWNNAGPGYVLLTF